MDVYGTSLLESPARPWPLAAGCQFVKTRPSGASDPSHASGDSTQLCQLEICPMWKNPWILGSKMKRFNVEQRFFLTSWLPADPAVFNFDVQNAVPTKVCVARHFSASSFCRCFISLAVRYSSCNLLTKSSQSNASWLRKTHTTNGWSSPIYWVLFGPYSPIWSSTQRDFEAHSSRQKTFNAPVQSSPHGPPSRPSSMTKGFRAEWIIKAALSVMALSLVWSKTWPWRISAAARKA